jgi:hypothetical protein
MDAALAEPVTAARATGPDDFYAGVPVFDGFGRIMEPGLYRPLPEDWVLGLADVVDSTGAIAAGRYKVVNTAGASAIAAVTNALGGREFPFAFGGDGAGFAVGAAEAPVAGQALAATAAWVEAELGLRLRTAMVPVSAVRAAGLDVRVARFAPSPQVAYAMFMGGGLGWAEREMKAGRFHTPPAAPDSHPDLNGLSCRWAEIPAERGLVLSLIVTPMASERQPAYQQLVGDVLALAADPAHAGRPMPEGGPPLRWPPEGQAIEAQAMRGKGGPLWLRRLRVHAHTLLAYAVLRTGIPVGGFNPKVYMREIVQNTDFRKYDDGLRMTIDCTPELADRIEARLRRAEAAGIARFGLHRQKAALMTCFVPAPMRHDHVHFIDGAAGGYAAAARRLKAAAAA